MSIENSVNYNKNSSTESKINDNDLLSVLNDSAIEKILREKEEEQEQYIQEQYDKGIIPEYNNKNNNNHFGNGNGKVIRNDEESNLDLSKELIKEGIVRRIFKHIKHTYIKIEFCGKYEGKTVILSTKNSRNWNAFIEQAIRMIKRKDIHVEKIIRLIIDTLDNNYNLVTGVTKVSKTLELIDSVKEMLDDNDKENKNDYPINKYSQGIPLAESILIDNIPYFIQIIDGKPVYKTKIELTDINIVPPERSEYLSKEYSFAAFDEVKYFIDLTKLETLDSLFKRVKTILKKYIDIDIDFINILTTDIIFTYFQDKLKMTHYLLIVGDNNTGKSNILLVFSFLGYRPVLDTAITPANIYNFGSHLEDGQCILLEDEIDDIDEQSEKKKYYKSSYRAGVKVTRMYDINSGPINSKRKSSRQNGFFLFGFKMFVSEKMPDKIKSKGFLERVIPLKATPGDPPYDIAEVVDGSGDEQFKELYEELMNTRKLFLMYRLLHYNDTIPDIKLNIKNRYKQLTKPVIRLFQNTESVDEITKSLSKYLIEKNQEKLDSIDSAILLLS